MRSPASPTGGWYFSRGLERLIRIGVGIGCVGTGVLPADSPAADSPVVAAFERFGLASGSPPASAVRPHVDMAAAAGGRVLVGELGCTACHASDRPDLAPKGGPALAGVGTRVSPGWLAGFLAAPAAAAPGTTMPHALAAVPAHDREVVVAALTAYLTTRIAPTPLPRPTGANPMPAEFWTLGSAARGDAIYHRVGCVACHDPDGAAAGLRGGDATTAAVMTDEEIEDLLEAGLPIPERPFASVPLGHVPAKYTRQGLTEFLMVPYHARPAGRMPDMKLLAAEAADLAAWLLADGAAAARPTPAATTAAAPDPALVARGREHFATLACGRCHDVGEKLPAAAPATAARPLAALDPRATDSCISADPPVRAAVHYPLDHAQRTAIVAALDGLAGAPPPETTPADRLETALLRLNCVGCHERGGRGGVGAGRRDWFETVDRVDLGDEGRLPPRLTGVGARLQKAWLAKAVAGSVELRPFMRVRMPRYEKDHVGPLPEWLRLADLPAAAAPPGGGSPAAVHTSVLDAAAAVLDAGCIQCHPLGDRRMPGVVGVNLAGVTRRVEPAWFRELLQDPIRVRPGTKMPAFFGPTIDRRILAGDAERQIAAVWTYLDRDVLEPVPARLLAAAASDHELVPEDRPIVLRTFMGRAGTHAVAVGFPAGVHVAFDGDRCRLAEAWTERFLDSRGTWLIRSAPPTDPLGTAAVAIDTVPPLAILAPAVPGGPSAAPAWPAVAADVRFLGYTLDAAGVPTFRHTIGGLTIVERIVPDVDEADDTPGPRRGLLRRLEVVADAPAAATNVPSGAPTAAGGQLWFCPLAGADLEVTGDTARLPATGLVATLPHAHGVVRPVADAAGHDGPVEAGPVEAGPVQAQTVRAWTVPLGPGSTYEVRYRW